MPQNIAGASLHGVALNQDFGHSPVGRLGTRTVQSASAQGPRAGAAGGIVAQAKGLATRVLDAATPHGLRAQSKVRAGLEATSARVGDLIGALSKTGSHKVDGAAALAAMRDIAAAAEPLTSRGAAYDAVLQQRIDVHLTNMSTRQLTELKDGLALARNSALQADASAAGHLALLATSTQKELVQRMVGEAVQRMQPVLDKSIAEVPRGPAAVDYQYGACYGIAANLLAEHGQDGSRDMQRALVKEAINTLVDSGTLDAVAVGQAVKLLPSREQRDLLDTTTHLGAEPPFTLERLLSGAVGVRAEQSETSFLAAADRLLAHGEPAVDDPRGPLRDPRGFAGEIVEAARHLHALRTHSDVHDLRIGTQVDPKLARLVAHLEGMLRPSNLLPGELNHEQLRDVRDGLAKLGVERGSDQLSAEVDLRKAAVVGACDTEVLAAATAAARGELGGMLRALERAQERGTTALLTHQKLGERIDDADKIMQFRHRLVMGAVAQLPEAQLQQVFAVLNSPEGRALAAACSEAGMALLPGMDSMEGRDPALGKRMFDTGIDLQMLELAVGDTLRAGGIALPSLPDDHAYAVADLGPRGQAALREAFGADVSTDGRVNVKIGVAGPAAQKIFQQNLAAVAAGRPPEHVEAQLGTGVCEAFWKDLPRAHYVVREDGGTRSLLERAARADDAPAREGQLRAAIAQVRALAGGSDALLMHLSRYANQNLLAGIQEMMLSPESPVRLPDGTPGRLMGPERITYTMGRDGEDGLSLRVDYAIRAADFFMDPAGGTMHPLDPQGSHAHFTFEIAIAPDGQARVSDPLQFLYELQPGSPSQEHA
ncbi:MAG TPA: hypothetical protein VFE82_18630 [Ramlibacter sp.]|jgi:hypothetical protein|uniref:hypothetical protein n=1 Tax=Ramlibacter sp. TaxID=1917967 RepID=UPI002D39FA63|nr:hypothetical protein [Ramlibacter sp.]HZY20492.1 hypothetical protein [Ramlibacter sp.]